MPQSSQTQDVDARFAVFLNPIRDLTKNWEVDIAKYLEEYLEELAEVQITFDGGQTMMNFAQAAMLIQGSATVYSKKVEFLWQMVLQMLDLLSSRRNVEASGDVEAREGGGGGGKATFNMTLEFCRADNINEGRNINMRDDEEQEDEEESIRRNFKFLPATPLHLVEKEGEKSRHRVSLLLKKEMFGAKDDFRINRSYLTPKGMLSLEVPKELLAGDSAIEPQDCAVYPVVNGVVEAVTENGDAEGTTIPPLPLPDIVPDEAADAAADIPDEDEVPDAPPDLPDDPVEPLPPPPPPIQEVNGKTGGSEKENNCEKSMAEMVDLPGKYKLRMRGPTEKEKMAEIKLTDTWKPLEPHAEVTAKRPVRAGRLRKPLPCACHLHVENNLRSRVRTSKTKVGAEDSTKKKSIPSIESYITNDLVGIMDSSVKGKKVPPELLEEVNKEVSKQLELSKQKKVKNLLNNGGAFDIEEAAQKVQEETQLEQRVEQLDDAPEVNGVADDDWDDDMPAPPLFLPEPHDKTVIDPLQWQEGGRRLYESQFGEPGSDYEALVQKWVADYITNAQEHIQSSELATRVNKWRENVLPKLEEEERRQEFDIHRYGSKILSYFPDDGRKQTIPFSVVAKNQEKPEVSRLFLSCLMLANTYNISLSNEEPGDFAMDCLELTLLSRIRHHEELEEYAAPSQSSPTKRKGRTKGHKKSNRSQNDGADLCSTPQAICTDITQITLAENIQCNSTSQRPKVNSHRKL